MKAGRQAPAVAPPPGNGQPLVSVRSLSVRYTGHRRAVYAVADVSLDVSAGQTLAVVGESGSGKSTLLRAIAGLVRPASGRVEVNGRVARARAGGAGVQMVFQDPDLALDPRQPVWRSVAEPLAPRRLRIPGGVQEPALALLQEVGLGPEIAGRKPHELSGGQRQRVTIARAVAARPALVLLDEPLSAQDVSLRSNLLKLLAALQRERSLTYLVVSHDIAAVARIADQVGVMYAAKLIEIGSAEQVLTHPRHPYTQALIATVPRVSAGRAAAPQVIHGEPPDLRQPPAGCRFHTRCAFAIQRCTAEEPALAGEPVQPGGHLVACHRWQEIAALPRSRSAPPGEAPTPLGHLAQGQP
jgi:oligopeptide/dipeptide ABC transporter ATP-binding protein